MSAGMSTARINVAYKFSGMALAGFVLILSAGCNNEPAKPPAPAPAPAAVTFKPQEMADALHAVIAADREVYALQVVQRLQADEHAIGVSQNWQQEKALPLPAQMLRMASEEIQKKGAEFHYILRSLHPINPKNGPQTETERTGLQSVVDQSGTNYYSEESLGGRRYFTAVYPDVARSSACVDCHNQHSASTARTYKVGEVMGGIIVRVPLEF
jgi:hypothetical protein